MISTRQPVMSEFVPSQGAVIRRRGARVNPPVVEQPGQTTTLTTPRAVVVRRQWLTCAGVKAIEIVAADGGILPAVAAGAHIDVHLPDGRIRQYSITTPEGAPESYLIAVLRDPKSRGGSSYLVEQLQAGDFLSITGPRNNFELDESGGFYKLIAGGIGVTPVIAMARRLLELGHPFEFHYLVRSRERIAFADELRELLPEGVLRLHVDEEAGLPDLAAMMGEAGAGHQIYACGPEPLLAAIEAAAADWSGHQIHFERFKNAARARPDESPDTTGACRVELRQSGIHFDLQPGETLLEALERQDLDMPSLCREGICGTCAVDVIEGEIDHRDALQDDDEKALNEVMYVCVSRPTGSHLVLDL